MPLLIPATTVPADGSFKQIGGSSLYTSGFILIGTANVDLVLQYSDLTGQAQSVEYLNLPPGQYTLTPSSKYAVTGFQIRAAGGALSSTAQYQTGLSEPHIPSIVPAGGGVGGPFDVAALSWQHNDALVAAENTADFKDSATVTWTLTDDPANGRMKISAAAAGGAVGGTRTIPVRLDTPDSAGSGYPALTALSGFTNVRRIVPAFTKSVDGTWEGSLEVPADYSSGGTIVLTWVANATTGNLRNRVGSQVVANGVNLDGTYTQETYLNTTVPGTAKQRFQTSFVLSTVLVAGSTLELQVTRNGTSGSDTLAVDALLMGCDLSYASAY